MEKIKLGLFDLFAYILPGSFLILSITCIIIVPNNLINLILSIVTKMNFGTTTVAIIACYICGFLGQYVGYELFKSIATKVWKGRMTGETSFGKMEDKIVQIRHFSPNNFNALHRWLALRGMCYGMFQALTIFLIVILIRSIEFQIWTKQRILLLIILGILSILFLRRAVTFHEWAHRTIRYSMDHMGKFINR